PRSARAASGTHAARAGFVNLPDGETVVRTKFKGRLSRAYLSTGRGKIKNATGDLAASRRVRLALRLVVGCPGGGGPSVRVTFRGAWASSPSGLELLHGDDCHRRVARRSRVRDPAAGLREADHLVDSAV